jgi:hypothetical protein
VGQAKVLVKHFGQLDVGKGRPSLSYTVNVALTQQAFQPYTRVLRR